MRTTRQEGRRDNKARYTSSFSGRAAVEGGKDDSAQVVVQRGARRLNFPKWRRLTLEKALGVSATGVQEKTDFVTRLVRVRKKMGAAGLAKKTEKGRCHVLD